MRLLSSENSVDGFSSSENEKLESILRFMHEKFRESIMLGEVSRSSGMSEASLTRFLKRRTGKTFIDTLNDIRISQAVCCLIDTSASITEICYNCGFNNVSNFNRIFKKRKGCTPTDYRQKYEKSRFKL
jgi:AraC-like DNA-binding protein